jgi:hypothetical protein
MTNCGYSIHWPAAHLRDGSHLLAGQHRDRPNALPLNPSHPRSQRPVDGSDPMAPDNQKLSKV